MKSWIEGAIQGETEAYEQLVTHFRGMALAVAYQQLQDAYGAEDVVQEAFTEAFANLFKLEKPEAFPGWFKIIVERQCYRWLRRKRHSVVPMQEVETVFLEEDQTRNPEAQAIQKELQETLRRSIAQLPSSMQVVVELFYFQGYTLKEISDFLDVNVSALKKRLFDARTKLKRSLPIRNLASVFNELHEGGKGMLHIMNGDHAANRLRESGIQGDILVWRELYTYGPVTTAMADRSARQHRAVVLEEELGIPQKVYLQIESLDEKLRSLQQYKEIVLWFEYDLYDQTMLSYLLHYFSGQDLQNIRLNLLCIDSYPEVEHFRGLGQLTPKQIGSLSGNWHVIEKQELQAGKQFWEAYSSSDSWLHQEYLKSGMNELPFAKAAFEAHLSRLPSVTNGLGCIEQTTLETIRAGIHRPYDLFRKVGDKLHVLGMGDLEYWAHLKRMSEGPAALIRMTGAASFPKYNQYDQAFRDAVLSLTELGIQVMNGEVDWTTFREDEYWVGGLLIGKNHQSSWRWNPAEKMLCEI
ncbi:RNA polymerase sigma factor (sigma-70 family) [Paenibacillus intestini]|uniref:Sigma-70 family RNA polymerase sigma factor n=1 Tax=Paenibacillus cucumis (ex Kampfer et al. 2016) TaxID=1776858 RepID=A0ABS7KLA3_9BACL|nr:sigma-70 family RNA polymerase sigma factor [Paenibacillus cucumis (ex Kampfer et al. 2016)]MBY0204937.1 sigma-70 family RNA polymerase sigma factor [Paenibacillus cucumis (ex Kampfer et al. 2016)]MDP9697479.1 RNA polymerase sigma factor (sigma-70 family) [Paenibacillus intestini]